MQQFIDNLISRLTESAIKTLGVSKSEFAMDKEEYSSYCSLSLYEVKEAVNQLAKEYKGGWIPCSERLPEEVNRHYLITYREVIQGEFYYFTKIDYLSTLPDGTKSWELEEAKPYVKVTAWQKVPKPYQKEGE